VEKGIEKLKSLQDRRTGGFLNSNEQLSTCSTAQVIVALSTLGIDAADWETSRGTTPLDAISKTYIATDAGFGENIGASYYDTIATEQAAYALVAYERFKNGKVALYDMKDVTETLASAASMEQVKAAAIALLNSTYYAYDKTKYTDRSQKALDQALDAALNGVKTADTADKVSEAKAAGLAAMAAVPTISSSAGSEGSQPSDSKITVTFRLIGCTQSTDKIDLSKQPGEYYGAKYENWIKTKTYTLDEGATVGSLFEKALGDAGISYDGLSGNYIKNINGIGELTNGAYSGWMYTVNGKHPNIGLNSYSLKDGDVVIWHYVNDYRYEVSDWSGTSNGSAATWDPWKNVPDTTGGSYVISPSTTEKDESDGSADPSQSGDNDEEQKAEATAAKIEKLTSGVKKTTVSAKSKVSSGSITISWVKSAGYKVDGYQIFRSTKKNSGYGTKPFFTTTKTTYKNTKSLKSGTRYYYKVRGYRKINGKTVYTEWSNKVSRVAA
jgi:hypothetical protein